MKRTNVLALFALTFTLATNHVITQPTGVPPKTRAFDFTYSAEIRTLPQGSHDVSMWIPLPRADANQDISELSVSSSASTRPVAHSDAEYGNQIFYVHLSQVMQPSLEVVMKFQVRRRELRRDVQHNVQARLRTEAAAPPDRWLKPDRLAPIDGRIRELALRITQGKLTELEKARAIYDFAVQNLKYDKTGTGWGRGDIYYACDVRRGNCTDFHALFIGLCRAIGIPARFEMGVSLPEKRGAGTISGYHCWAQFYLKGYGWVPVDAAEASKNPAKIEYFFGGHDENRLLFSVGRDLRLNPPQSGEPLNFFIQAYAEVDGKPFSGVETTFAFKDLP